MAKTTTHPYITSAGILVQTFTQFRKSMPAKIDAGTLKKLGLASGNEAKILGVLRFLGVIDDEGKKSSDGSKLFLNHGDEQFSKALEKCVRKAYAELFELRGNESWDLDRDSLIGFFRATDETSALTGKRQAFAFETLAALSGHGEVAAPRAQAARTPSKKKVVKKSTKADKAAAGKITNPDVKEIKKTTTMTGPGGVALTVRIEVNLPAQADQETYDRIFKSIRSNLLDS